LIIYKLFDPSFTHSPSLQTMSRISSSSSSSSSRPGSGVPFGGLSNGILGPTFQSGGHTISSNTGALANPSRAAQHAANNAGALTNREANAIGLHLAGRPSGPFSGPSRALTGFPR
jgi:hypothetical protein